MQNSRDADTAYAYGEGQPTFGGTYFDGDTLVAMFTCDLDVHDQALRSILAWPDQVQVKHASRSWAEVQLANARVQSKLKSSQLPPEVNGVGIGMADGQFSVTVSLEHPTPELEDAVRAAAAPDDVQIIQRGRARRR